jgi:glutaredoxin
MVGPEPMRRATAIVILLAAGGLVSACHGPRRPAAGKRAPAAAHAPAAPAAPPAGDTVYTWYDARGLPHTTSDRAAIPAAFRSRVVVSNLDGAPADGLADQVTVANLSGARPTYSKVDLAHLGKAGDAPDGKALLADDHRVTVYGTSWCHYCKQARAWLKSHHVAFADKDIEADPQAAANLQAKLKAAGIRFGGVPVLDVRGHLIVGFDPKALAEALRSTGAQASPPKDHG